MTIEGHSYREELDATTTCDWWVKKYLGKKSKMTKISVRRTSRINFDKKQSKAV